MIVIQDIQNQTTLALAQTFQWCGLEYVLWNTEKISIFDMFYECRPDLLIVNNALYKSRGEELLAGRKNNSKVCVLGTNMVCVAENLFCTKLAPFSNLITNTNVKFDPAYACDLAVITSDLSDEDVEYLKVFIDIMKNVWEEEFTFRMYGPKVIDSPYWVGNVARDDYNLIYKHTDLLYDCSGEHYLNSFLHGNAGVKLHEGVITAEVVQDEIKRNNFEATALILANCGVEQMIVDHVKTKGTEFVNKYWTSGKQSGA